MLTEEQERKLKDKVLKYCSTICRAKCCMVYHNSEEVSSCPKLTPCNTCSIYKERYEDGEQFHFGGNVKHKGKLLVIKASCGNVRDVIKSKELPRRVIKQCCIAHPGLLKRVK